MSGVVNVQPAAVPTATPTNTPTETPVVTPTDTVTNVPPGSTATDTPTISPTFSASPSFSASPTATFSPTITVTYTPGTPGIQFFQGAPDAILAPNPIKAGQTVCLYFSGTAGEGKWDAYNSDGERVAHLSFSGAGLQCWETTGLAPGLYFVIAEATLVDGTLKKVQQKVVLLR